VIFPLIFHHSLGLADKTSLDALDSNYSKFLRNILPSYLRVASYSSLFFHVFFGMRTSSGTPAHLVGTLRPKTSNILYSALAKSPS